MLQKCKQQFVYISKWFIINSYSRSCPLLPSYLTNICTLFFHLFIFSKYSNKKISFWQCKSFFHIKSLFRPCSRSAMSLFCVPPGRINTNYITCPPPLPKCNFKKKSIVRRMDATITNCRRHLLHAAAGPAAHSNRSHI